MKVVDANILLYAVNEDSIHHADANAWLDRALGGEDTVGLSWIVLLAFVRISTRPGIFAHPLQTGEAMQQVDDWITAPGGVAIHPGPAHVEHLATLLGAVGHGGNLVNDAHLAALALEHRAEIVSYDTDFARFPAVRRWTPGQLLG